MIDWVERVLVRWADQCRLSSPDLAGLGYPRGASSIVLAEPSRAKRRVDKNNPRPAGVLRAGLSGGVMAHGVATRSSGGCRAGTMPADLERLDRFVIAELGSDEQRLLEVRYVDNFHTVAEKAGVLGVSVSTMYKRLDALHVRIDNWFRPGAAARVKAAAVDREIASLMAAVSGGASR